MPNRETDHGRVFQDDIIKYGSPVTPTFVTMPDQEGVANVYFAAYPGVASVFAVIVR